jgi:hypothetical protein
MVTKKLAKVEPKQVAWRFAELVKPMIYRDADSKYLGDEPKYPTAEVQATWTAEQYRTALGKALNWYGYTQDSKKSAEWLHQFLSRNPRRQQLADAVKRGDVWPGPTAGYALRAARVGLQLRYSTLKTILNQLHKAQRARAKIELTTPFVEEVPKAKTFNIQERLAEKTAECAGEIEGRFDDFITTGEYKTEIKVIDLLSQFNVQPAHIKTIISLAERRIGQYEEVIAGKDSQLVEAYRHMGKRQLTACVKWWQQVLADCNSYGIIKKASKAPRKKKAVSPEKVVSKLAYMKEFAELKLKSVEPTQILTAQELWVYNTKTRKLGIYIADQYAGALGVKGKAIVGFDAANSVQKTLRKPKDQLKEFSANGKPAAKKWFKGVKSVETKLNGRVNGEIILLKAYK